MNDPGTDQESSHSGRWDEKLARLVWWGRPASATLGERTRRRVWIHLLPILFLLYILAYIDRSNISIAKFGMTRPVAEGGLGAGFADSSRADLIIGFGSGVFFWGYWILEIPSTLAVERRGARRVFCRILVLWGLCAVLMGFMGMPLMRTMFGWLPQFTRAESWPVIGAVARHWNALASNAESQFYFLRFMLGFFEGGFFPTVVMYLSLWFIKEHRAKAMASFMAAMPLSNVIGAPLSQAISTHIQWGGLPGWRWIYILEGIAPVLAGFFVLFCLPDRPSTAAWLPPEERDWLAGELEKERLAKAAQEHGAWRRHLGIVLLLTLFYFCQNVVSYGMSTFMPSIVNNVVHTGENKAAWITALFYLTGFVVMQINSWHSDRKRERMWHVAWPMLTIGAGLLLVTFFPGSPVFCACVLIGMIGACLYAHVPPFWAIPTMYLGSTAAASAIGFINMTGNFGGFVGPVIVGDAAAKEDFATGLGRIAIFPFIAAALILAIAWLGKRRGAESPLSK